MSRELALQDEQRGDRKVLPLMFQYHCWGKQQQHEKEEPGWTQRYNAARGRYKDSLYRHMDQLSRCDWQRAGGRYPIARKLLKATEPCSSVIDDANRAIAALVQVLEGLGDPVTL
jgi:hypothetical protein